MYSLNVAVKALRTEWKTYVILFVELLICFYLIILGVNKDYSEAVRIDQVSIQDDLTYTLQVGDYNPVLSETQQDQLTAAFPEFRYGEVGSSLLMSGNKVETIPLVYGNEFLMQDYLEEAVPDTVYLSQSLYHRIVEAGGMIEKWHLVDDSQLTDGHTRLAVSLFEDRVDPIRITSFQAFSDLNLNETVILPFSARDGVQGINQTIIQVPKAVGLIDETIQTINQAEILADRLQIQPMKEQFVKGTTQLMAALNVFSWASKVALMIVLIGVVGILLIYLDKRKQRLYLSLLFGASKWRLLWEIYMELCLLMLPTSLLAFALVLLTQAQVSSVYYEITTSPLSWALMGLLPLIIALLPLIIVLRQFVAIDYTQVIKNYE